MSYKGLRDLPVYKKAVELQTMGRAIALCAAGNKAAVNRYRVSSLRSEVAGLLMTDTALIRKQIALAAGTPSLSIRQNSLQFVSIMIRNLGSYCRGLEMDGMREREYLELLRHELVSFRKSFKQWRKSLGN
ncbi:MAG: hypothetical protein R3252_00830 [Robiginitalea sp.]|nr:hypothetical protein [Robiginitalea sp.]